MASLTDIHTYLAGKEPIWRDLTFEKAEPIMRWFAAHGLLLVVADERGKVAGVAAVRRVADWREGHEHDYAHRDDAPVLWVSWVGAEDRRAMASLLDGVKRRWPDNPPRLICGVKARHGDIPRSLNFETFKQKLQHL